MLAFVSHDQEDNAIYTTLCLAFKGEGIEWWDPSTLSLGGSLAEQLREAIRKCDVCVFVATRQSIVSGWCLAELGAFWGAGKRVFLFKQDPRLSDNDLPQQFKGSLWTSDAASLIAALRRVSSAQADPRNTPANLFWLGHDLARAIRFAMFEPSAHAELQNELRQALHHLEEVGLEVPDARTLLLTAIKTHSASTTLSEEKRKECVTAIAQAKNELGSTLQAFQPGFRGYPTIERVRRLDEELKTV